MSTLPDGPPQLWLDVTAILKWSGPLTGVPRTIASIAQSWLDTPGLRLQLCHNRRHGVEFLATTRAEFRRALERRAGEPPPKLTPKQPPRPKRLWRQLAQACVDCLPEAARRPALDCVDSLATLTVQSGALGKALLDGLLPRRRPQAAPPPPVNVPERPPQFANPSPPPFQPGDVLVQLGGGWSQPYLLDTIQRCRQDLGIRFVGLVYDLIPVLFPQYYTLKQRDHYRSCMLGLLQHADGLLAISNNTRTDLLELARSANIAAPPIGVIRLGDRDLAGVAESARRPQGLPPDRPYVLCVSTLEPRKNHHLLYHLWRRLIQRHGEGTPLLVCAGRRGWLSDDLHAILSSDPITAGHIVFLENTSDHELAWLYQHCSFTVYPSHYEGWGLPVAESLAFGKYCIASNTSSVREIAPDLVDLLDPLDLPAWEQLVEKTLFDDELLRLREERVRAGYPTTAWETCARTMLEQIEGMCGVSLQDMRGSSGAAA